MALLDYLLGNTLRGPIPGLMPAPGAVTQESPLTPEQEAEMAAAARIAAADRLGARRGPTSDTWPALPGAAPGLPAGMLSGVLPMTAPAGFDALDAGPIPGDPQSAAADARSVAARRVRGAVRRESPWTDQAAVPGVGPVAGLLSGMNMTGVGGAGSDRWDANGGDPAVIPGVSTDPLSSPPQVVASAEVPLPRPRPAGIDPTDVDGNVPMPLSVDSPESSAPTDVSDTRRRNPVAAAPMPGSEKSFLDRIFDPNKAATWLALGSGFAGAGSVGTGMRRAFGAAVPAMAADRAQIMKQSSISDTYRALVAKGVDPAEALAASQNPDIMKAVASKYFEGKPRVPHKIGTDWLGNEIMGSFDPNTGRFYDAAGQQIAAKGGAAGAGAGGSQGATPMLAKGVGEYNPELGGDDYLAQFSPEVQSAIKSYVRGDTMPTGNPRLKGMEGKVKEFARLYGDKTGIPVSDATFAERKKFRTELGSASANTVGGQTKAFNQGIEHAEALSKKLEALGNVDPVGIPSVAHGINWTRQAFSSKQTGVAKEAAAIGQTLAGEVGKLFSGAAGGGVHERELTRQRFNTITTPYELAGALEATLETMEGGLRALEQRRDSALGPNNDVELVTKGTREKIDSIRGTIARLKGEAPAQAPAAAPRLNAGQSTTINGVTIKRLN